MKKIPYADCAAILARFELSEEAVELLDPAAPPEAALEILHQAGLVLDVINFFAHALPPREGICWALSMLTGRVAASSDAVSARREARNWVNEPNEQLRRRCGALGDALGTGGPDGWLCNAVFWNGSGSIVTPDLPVVLPQPFLHAKAVFGTIGLMVPTDDDQRAEFTDHVYRTGLAVAQGGWPCLDARGEV
jgi:hypothetical protein